MKGLILKDILNFKNQQGKTFLLIIVLYFFMALQMNNSSFFAGVWMILGLALSISSIAYDEKAKWDKYALTMPVTRKDIVVSKYLLSIIFIVAGDIISLPLAYIIDKNISMETLAAYGILMAISIMFTGIILPFVFKFGAEKSRIIMILIAAILWLIVYFIHKINIDINMLLEKYSKVIGITIAVSAVAIYIFSYLISVFIMEHKEIA